MARCWSRMSHASGDRVARGDCVLLRASLARAQPFVARVASLWENPDDGMYFITIQNNKIENKCFLNFLRRFS